jgi:hypothetical protein
MTDRWRRDSTVDSGGNSGIVGPDVPTDGDVDCTEAYEQDDLVVLYDAENPLAWIEADSAVEVETMT